MAALPQRRRTRAAHIDYAAPGAYFVTIVCQGRELIFGEVGGDATMVLSEAGRIVETAWRSLSSEIERVALDAFVVMPNHVHGIVWLRDRIGVESVGAGLAPPGGENREHHIAKTVVGDASPDCLGMNPSSGGASPAPTGNVAIACEARAESSSDGASPARGDARRPARCSLQHVVRVFKSRSARAIGRPIWQRSFHDHVIRGEDDLAHARRYIAENPLAWALDPENPARRVPA